MMAWDTMIGYLIGNRSLTLVVVKAIMEPMVVGVSVHKEGQAG
jgi:hypothetical protein